MPAALAGALAFGATSSVVGGFSANSAANQEAKLQQQQGGIALAEAQANAQNETFNQNQAVGKQRLAFLANGVTLEGSPSMVIDQSTKYGQQQVDSILKHGTAVDSLAIASAAQTRNQGRAALIGGIGQAISTTATGTNSLYKAGAFDKKAIS